MNYVAKHEGNVQGKVPCAH